MTVARLMSSLSRKLCLHVRLSAMPIRVCRGGHPEEVRLLQKASLVAQKLFRRQCIAVHGLTKAVSPFSWGIVDVSDIACEFLEAAFHMILKIREIYPAGAKRMTKQDTSFVAETFERRRYYNVPIYRARHPELIDYIHSVIASLRVWLEQATVDKVALVIYNGSRQLLERFVFAVRVSQGSDSDVSQIGDIEYALRAVLIKLSTTEPLLQPLPPDCSWEVMAYAKILPETSSAAGRQWVSVEEEKHAVEMTTVVPVKSLGEGPLQLQLFIEMARPR